MEQTKTSIALCNGEYFDFKKPEEHIFDIDVIASALSNICRYTGHVNKGLFYSVAEHCVLVSHVVPKQYALEGLLHDASEAYCGDVASPLKKLLPGYRKIEEAVQEALAKQFNLEYPFPPDIHIADKRVYIRERETIASCGKDTMWHTDVGSAKNVAVVGYNPNKAYSLFIRRFEELNNDRMERNTPEKSKKLSTPQSFSEGPPHYTLSRSSSASETSPSYRRSYAT